MSLSSACCQQEPPGLWLHSTQGSTLWPGPWLDDHACGTGHLHHLPPPDWDPQGAQGLESTDGPNELQPDQYMVQLLGTRRTSTWHIHQDGRTQPSGERPQGSIGYLDRPQDILAAGRDWHTWENVSSSNRARNKHDLCSHGDLVYLTSHAGNKFGCGQILYFLTNNHGDDVAVMNVLHLKKLSETFAEWEDKRSHVVVPLQGLLVAVTFAKDKQKITTLTPWSFRWKGKKYVAAILVLTEMIFLYLFIWSLFGLNVGYVGMFHVPHQKPWLFFGGHMWKEISHSGLNLQEACSPCWLKHKKHNDSLASYFVCIFKVYMKIFMDKSTTKYLVTS